MNDNLRLKRQNYYLTQGLIRSEALIKENKRLKRMLDFKDKSTVGYIPAKVVAMDVTNLVSAIIIDKGKNYGIKPGKAVVTELGLVGKTIKATKFSTTVLLITDPNLFVCCRLQRGNHLGLVSGRFSGYLKMQYVPLDADVQKGDIVVTAGISVQDIKSIYPEGIPVGTVFDVISDDSMQAKTVLLKPLVNLNTLTGVLVAK